MKFSDCKIFALVCLEGAELFLQRYQFLFFYCQKIFEVFNIAFEIIFIVSASGQFIFKSVNVL